jgi:hypothetical protein
MQHFSHVYDVCRAALTGDTAMAKLAVKSLRESLAASRDTLDVDDAVLLERLLNSTSGKRRKPVVHFVTSEEPAAAPAPRRRRSAAIDRRPARA